MTIQIAPSLLAADPGNYQKGAQFAENIGADLLHIDVMDGSFVPPITFGDNIVKVCKQSTKLFLDVHLMIKEPENHFEAFAKAGSDRIIFHLEACKNVKKAIQQLNDLKVKPGLAINPETEAKEILEYLPFLDLALVMTVNPGWGGQSFIENCLEKITIIKKEIEKEKLNTHIEVDGGINSKTGKQCIAAGANILVSGSYLYSHENPANAVKELRA